MIRVGQVARSDHPFAAVDSSGPPRGVAAQWNLAVGQQAQGRSEPIPLVVEPILPVVGQDFRPHVNPERDPGPDLGAVELAGVGRSTAAAIEGHPVHDPHHRVAGQCHVVDPDPRRGRVAHGDHAAEQPADSAPAGLLGPGLDRSLGEDTALRLGAVRLREDEPFDGAAAPRRWTYPG